MTAENTLSQTLPPRSSFIGIHTRTRDMKLLFISGGTRNATGFTPSDVVDKCVEDFVVEDYGADDFMGMYDLRSANSTDDDDASAYCWFTNLRHAQGMSVLHRIVSFKLDNCVIFIATAFPELPCTSHRELEVQVLDGQMSCLNATRKRKACEKLLKQCGQSAGDSRCRQAKAALVLEHPDSSEFEPPDPPRRTAGPLIAFVTGSVSQLVDADPSDLFRFPFMRLVAPEHLVLVGRFFARLNNTAEVLFEKFSLLQRPHVIEGDVEVRDVENNRVHVECLASAVDDGVVLLIRKLRVNAAPQRDNYTSYMHHGINTDDQDGFVSLSELISSDGETSAAPDWSKLS